MPMEVIQVKMRPTLTQHLLEEEHLNTDSRRRWSCDHKGRNQSVISTSQGMTKFANKLQKTEQERKDPLVESEREHVPANTLISDFQLQDWGALNFFFKLPSLWYFVIVAPGNKYYHPCLEPLFLSGLVKWWYSFIISWKTSIKRNISFTTIWNSVQMAKVSSRFTCLCSER